MYEIEKKITFHHLVKKTLPFSVHGTLVWKTNFVLFPCCFLCVISLGAKISQGICVTSNWWRWSIALTDKQPSVAFHLRSGRFSITSWTGSVSSCKVLWETESPCDLGQLWKNGAVSLASSWTGLPKASSWPAPSLPRDVWLTYTTITSPLKFITWPLEMKVVLWFPDTWPEREKIAIS